MIRRVLTLALLAGTAGTTLAQNVEVYAVDPATETPEFVSEGGYAGRVTPVWSNGRPAPAVNVVTIASLYDVFDDIDFTGGPWENATGRVITRMNFGYGQAASAPPGSTIAFRFYVADDVDAAGGGFENATDMIAGVEPVAMITYQAASTFSGSAITTWVTINAGGSLPAGGVALPDGSNRFYVRATIHDRDNLDSVWTGPANAFRWRVANDLTVGSGTTNIGMNTFNINTAPYFTGNPNPGRGWNVAADAGTTPEHRNLAYPPSTGTVIAAADGKGLFMIVSGDLVLPDPTGTTDLGVLADGFTTVNYNAAPGETKWYKFSLAGDANDNARQFLDIDTEGSGVNASIALYQAVTGELLRTDANDGSGDNAQLTYGVGRRAGVNNGEDYDGRDGELLATGEYLVAITSGDAIFGPTYSVNSSGPGGALRLRFNTNTNGTPLAPSIPPSVEGTIFDLGDITQMTSNPPPATLTARWVVWYRFEVCSDVNDDGNEFAAGPYLDVDFTGSFPGSDNDVVVFDGNGNLIASEALTPPIDDAGTGLFAQISWGDQSPPRPSAGGDGLDFAGQQGNLASGVYYMAVGMCCLSTVDERWHARSSSGSTLTPNFSLYFEGIEQCGSGCSDCAADYNQDGGVDGGDVEAFFIDWENAEGCSDVNQDGGVDGSDVEFFFLVWEQGGC